MRGHATSSNLAVLQFRDKRRMVDTVDNWRKQARKAAGMDVVRYRRAYVLGDELTTSGDTRKSRAVRGIVQLMQATDAEMSEFAPSLGTGV